jgi:site-specific DNA-methyltransferase (adenine-specific)
MTEFDPILITGDSRVVMGTTIPPKSIDLIVTSPPYNCKIKYDSWDDEKQYAEYLIFMREWLVAAYNVLKDDGRIALNLFYEISQPGRGGRVFVISDVWQIMKEVGFEFHGIVRLDEDQSERINYCAWGSWKSPSAPYIYNPEECVLIASKPIWKKQHRGVSTIDRDEFMTSVKGVWKYRAQTSTKTQASFSIDLPLRAINILSYAGDTVLDPFSGRGTTGSACKVLGRKYIGIDISENYNNIARTEIDVIVEKYKKKNDAHEIVAP